MRKAKESSPKISIPVYARKWEKRIVGGEVSKRIRQGEREVLHPTFSLRKATRSHEARETETEKEDVKEVTQTQQKNSGLVLNKDGWDWGCPHPAPLPDFEQPRRAQSGTNPPLPAPLTWPLDNLGFANLCQRWEGLNDSLNFVLLQIF